MHKEYKHPAPYRPAHDYRKMMHEADAHIMDLTHRGVHPGQAQHLGGMASYHDHLQEMHYGEACAIKKELKRVIDYLYMYSDTGHDIYHFLAEDAFMHVEQLQADIHNPEEKEHARYFLECVREYMGWLKADKTGTEFKARQPSSGGNPGAVNL